MYQRHSKKQENKRNDQEKSTKFTFQDLLRALAPDYEVPDATHLATLVDEDQLNLGLN